MATGVGLRVADDGCTAAVLTDVGELNYIERECVLHMSDDGDTVLGGPAPEGPAHTISGFVAKLGDPAGIPVDDGEAYRAEDLVATALFCLIDLTTEHLAGAAEFFATHPGDWPAEYVQALREALDYLGLKAVVLTSEADLPSAGSDVPGKKFAYDAARAALTAVLATPAGLTPPDPTTAENSTVVTDIFPAVVAAPEPQRAYSAAMPVAAGSLPAVPVAAAAAVPGEPGAAVPAQTVAEPQTASPVIVRPQDRLSNRITMLIGIAALTGLVLGGIGIGVLLQREESPAPPNFSDALPGVSSTTTPPAPTFTPPPVPLEPVQPPVAEETTTSEAPTTTPEPTTTESTTEAPTTTAEPTTTQRPTTTTRRNPFVPYNPGIDDWRTPYWRQDR